jgi:hypothetical protein
LDQVHPQLCVSRVPVDSRGEPPGP